MKNFFILFCAVFICVPVFSQTEVSQVTLPKKIYIGDTVELQYSFYSPADLFESFTKEEQIVPINVKAYSFPIKIETEDYTILSASLKRSGMNYVLSMFFIPWKQGAIVFPNLDLAFLLNKKSEASFVVQFEAVQVASIIKENNITNLRPSLSPVLLPGTMYVFYISLLLLLILVIATIRIITHWQKIVDKMNMRKQLKAYEKNARKTERRLAFLEKNIKKLSDSDFCLELQHLIRTYLEFRFNHKFTAISTPQMMNAFEELTAGLMTNQKLEAAMSVTAVLKRTDYIRYAQNSLDSKREPQEDYSTELKEEERGSLIRITKDAVNRFEEKKQYA